MKEGKKPSLVKAFDPFVPKIERMATKVMSLANLNRTVHLPTYNKLIGEEALGFMGKSMEVESTGGSIIGVAFSDAAASAQPARISDSSASVSDSAAEEAAREARTRVQANLQAAIKRARK